MLEAGKFRAVGPSAALPGGGLRRAPAALLLLVAALALFLFGGGGVGQAQATQTLVSNTGQGSDSDYTSTSTRGQAFTTGYNPRSTTAPTAMESTVIMYENTRYAFRAVDFKFSATTVGDTLTSVQILTLPALGRFRFSSPGSSTNVVVNQTVTKAALDRGGLTYQPPANGSGSGYVSFMFKVSGSTETSAIAYSMTVDVTNVTDPPTAMPNTVTTPEDTRYVFTAADFKFSATDHGDALTSVLIETLPARGEFRIYTPGQGGAGSSVPVVVNQTVTKAALDSEYLTYNPPANDHGSGYASFTFKVIGNTEASTDPYSMTVDVTGVNDPPTGLPTISGIPEGRRTLTVSTVDIADVDGLTSVVYRYTWKRYAADGITFEGDIGDSTTYMLTEGDVGKKVGLKLAFEDDGRGSERLFSATFPPTGTVRSPVLVSTTEQEDDVHSEVSADRGQAFTTGRNASGYNVTGVTIESTDPEGDNVALQICEVDRDGNPTTTCWDLNAPRMFVAGPLTFTVPSDPTLMLASLTTYMAVFKSPGRENLVLGATSSSAEDAASLPDWSMRHGVRVKLAGGWSLRTPTRVLRMTIQGTANAASSTGPTARDSRVATTEDTPYTFTAADFNFVATTLDDTLASVRIHTLPADGALALNGVDVTAAQSVTRTQLNARQLEYRPADNGFGMGYAAFQFVVSGASEASSSAYWMTIDVSAVNDAATGAPAIEGTAQVGETLTASTTPIADLDGLPGAFNYQWIRVDADGSSNAADIIGADPSMYELTESEEGKKVKVEVSFMDNGGASETRVSAAYPSTGTVAAALGPNTAPTAMDSAVTTDEDTDHTFAAANFSYADSDDDDLDSVKITGLPAAGKGALTLNGTAIAAGALPKTVTATELDGEKLKYSPPANAHGRMYASFTFKVNDGRADSADEYDMTITVDPVQDAATGAPTISGTAQVDQILTASTALIVDPDGRVTAFEYQWKRYAANGTTFEADIGADSSTYTLTASEVGKKVKVEVSFYDFSFNLEAVLSAAYPASGTVAAAPGVNTPPTAMDSTVNANENTDHTFTAAEFRYADIDGDGLASVKITGLPGVGTLTLDGTAIASTALPKTVTAPDLTTSKLKYTPPANQVGALSFKYKVNDGMADSAEYTMTINVTAVNRPATGAPTISGTAQVGQTLAASTTPIDDLDGLPSVFTYQWIRVDADGRSNPTNIGANANASTYALTESEEGKKVKVEVSFVDSGGASETRVSAAYPATGTVAAAPVVNTPPTAMHSTVTTNEETDHTFAAADFSYTDSNGDPLDSVKITGLPATGKGRLTLDGTAITSGDLSKTVTAADLTASKLKYTPPANATGMGYASFKYKVNDGTVDSAAEYTMTINVTAVNRPATGAPTISGTAQVGQTLTASTTPIADPDGLPSAFNYQWMRVDDDGTSNATNIGAKASMYELTENEEGKRVKVEVSFVDSGGASETRVSAAYPSSGTVLQLTVQFERAAYTVAEGGTVTVTVTLSADPERTVVIPLTKEELGGAESTDYSGVPADVTFNAGDTSKSFTFTATQDNVDDDGESVKLAFDTPPTGVSAGTTATTTVSIDDDDDPQVTVQFEQAAYTVAEGGTQSVTVRLSENPERTVVIPLMKEELGRAESTDYSGVPADVTFNAGDRSKSFTFTATQDNVDDDGESVKLAFGPNLPSRVSAGTTATTTVSIVDDDDPQVTVQFEQAAYTVAEGGTQSVTVRLSADPERTVVIPLMKEELGGAESTDYSGVPADVTFNAGDRLKSFTFTATQDNVDDDGESVKLAFGPNLPSRVSAGTPATTAVSITDDDDPQVTVSFEQTAYTVAEGETQSVTVRLSADPERTVVIPLMKEELGGAESTDYSGVPPDVTFNAGDRLKSFTFTATQDTVDDDGESVKLAFDTPPTRVSVGTTATTTVSIDDDDGAGVSVSRAALPIGEGRSGTYTIVLDSQPTANVTVTINDPPGNTDVTAEPASLTFSSSDWSSHQTVTVDAAQDGDADNETATVTHTVTSTDSSYRGATASSVIVSVTDDDDVPVTVSFWAAAYTVAEGGTQSVTVTLSADPRRTVVIPVEATHQGDASSADYSVPASVTFNAGDTSKSLTFTALLDAEDDDGESVKLAFGTPLPSGVSAGTTAETTVTITVTTGSPPIIFGGGGGGGGGGGPSPSVVDFKWTVKHDIAELGGGHDTPSGTWSDGATLWVLENGDGADDAIYAYDLKTGERVEGREFKLDEANRAPRGVWSDRTVLWVSDSGRNHLFAHDLATGKRLPERDIAFAERNRAARGIWSDEETMWVLDGGKASLFAYDLASGELLDEYELASGNGYPHGIWSDGVTVWVSDQGAKRLFAYRLPARPEALAAEDAERQDLERVIDEEFKELSKASNNSPRGLWSDGDVMYVADESDGRVYTYNMPAAFDARLASLSLSRVDIGEFDPGRIDYEGSVAEGVTETTVKAATVQRRTRVEIDPSDADVRARGHQVSLEDLTEITVTVTSAAGSRKKTYRVRLGPAGRAPDCLRGDVAVGFSLVVYAGGSVEDLAACAESRHVTALYTLDDGEYVSYILGAPEFVNEDFRALFADGIPALMPLTVKSDGPATAAPVASAVTGPWAACLQGEIGEGFNLVVYEGGSIDDLVACVEGAGLAAVYTLNDGAWVSHIPGAPDFVNRSFRELFTDGLTVATPLVGKRD